MNVKTQILERVEGDFDRCEEMLFYFGFNPRAPKPTFDQTAEEFKLNSRQHAEQIRNRFLPYIVSPNIQALTKLCELLSQRDCWNVGDFVSKTKDEEIDLAGLGVLGMLRLFDDGHYDCEHQLFDSNLDKVLDRDLAAQDSWLLIKRDLVNRTKPKLKRFKKLPSASGIYPFKKFEENADDREVVEVIKSVRAANSDYLSVNCDGEEYFLFEGRSNALVNRLAKVAHVFKVVKMNELCESLHRSLLGVPEPPEIQTIEAYLRASKKVQCVGELVSFRLPSEPPTGADLLVLQELRSAGELESPDLMAILREKGGYRDVTLNKALRNSPFVFVDESDGRRNHRFRLLGEVIISKDDQNARYDTFVSRLLELTKDGSDVESESFRRKEQATLREFLFDGKESEQCAICGTEFQIKALIAAHKKQRSTCDERERSDPYVVMPLCKFGCDYLYEERLVKIINGSVRKTADLERFSQGELRHLDEIEGRKIDAIWLLGNPVYFD
jgi:hypothetical protein